MDFKSIREKNLEESITKIFGNSKNAEEIKQAVLLSQTGKLTDEIIEQYKKHKEEEQERIRQQFSELNPSYAFDYPKETETIVLSNGNIE